MAEQYSLWCTSKSIPRNLQLQRGQWMTSVVVPAFGMKIFGFEIAIGETEEVRIRETSDLEGLLIEGLDVSKMI